jgi:hypothetical protein
VLDAVLTIEVLDGARLTYFGLSSEYFLVGAFACWPLGGRAGNSHSPHAGALIRLAESVDFVRVAVTRADEVSVVLVVPLDAVDATEPLLSSSIELFLVGRGGGCFRTGG